MNDNILDDTLPGFSQGAPDPLRQVEEAGFWLQAYRQGATIAPLRMYQVADRLDQLMQGHRLKLTREYLDAGGRQQTYREQRIWHAIVNLARELAACYETSLQLFQVGNAEAKEVASVVTTLTARAVRALTLELRWILLRYGAIEPTSWHRMGSLFAYAERRRFMSQRIKVYPGMTGDSTVRREYLRALVLSVSGTEKLLPGSQVVAERVISMVAEFFLLHRQAATGCHFAVDLLASRQPYRIKDGSKRSRDIRYFGPGDAAVLVQRLIERTKETQLIPHELNLQGEFRVETVLEVLQHLAHEWGPNPPSRAAARQRVLSTLVVAHGWDDVLVALSAPQTSTQLEEITEAWTVENESSGGFGAALPSRDSDWLAVGELIACKPTWPGSWNVGVIRRLSTDAMGRRVVGVQILARGCVGVDLSPLPFGTPARYCSGMLLPAEAQTGVSGGEVMLALPRNAVVWNASYLMQVHDHNYTVKPHELVEGTGNFDLLRFTIDQTPS